MDKNSKIYITGHEGMVGKTMLNFLKKKGFSNIVIRTREELDLKNQEETEKFFLENRPEYVFHFAAKVGGIMANIENPASFLYDNLMINSNVLHFSYEVKVKKLLYLGSSCVYPKDSKQPMKESDLLSGKLEPTNEGYALSKIAGLKLCEFYNKQYKTNFISLMPCNLYGINEKIDATYSHVIAGLIQKFHEAKIKKKKSVKLWGTGKAMREFLYVEDLVDASFYFMNKYNAEDLDNQFINIGGGRDISVYNLSYLIRDIVGFNGIIEWDSTKPDGMLRKLLDVSRMKKLGWFPKILLKEGIEKTYSYFLKKYSKDGK